MYPYCGAEFNSTQALTTHMKAYKKKVQAKDTGDPPGVGPEHLNIKYL